jgi:hypothetical protein
MAKQAGASRIAELDTFFAIATTGTWAQVTNAFLQAKQDGLPSALGRAYLPLVDVYELRWILNKQNGDYSRLLSPYGSEIGKLKDGDIIFVGELKELVQFRFLSHKTGLDIKVILPVWLAGMDYRENLWEAYDKALTLPTRERYESVLKQALENNPPATDVVTGEAMFVILREVGGALSQDIYEMNTNRVFFVQGDGVILDWMKPLLETNGLIREISSAGRTRE